MKIEIKPGVEITVKITSTYVEILSGTSSRLKAISKKSKRAEYIRRPIGEHRSILEKWNTYSLTYEKNGRNKKTTVARFAEAEPLIKQCIKKKIDLDKISEYIDLYFEKINKGEHFWNKINHAYSDLTSFVQGILSSSKRKTVPWYCQFIKDVELKKIEDPNIEITELFISLYGKRILKDKDYTVENPSKDYEKFAAAGMKYIRFKRRIKVTLKDKILIKMIVDILKEEYPESTTIRPGNFASDDLWIKVLPQKIKEML